MMTGVVGMLLSTGVASIASTTDVPSMTFPNTAYPKSRTPLFRNALSLPLMKNWSVALSTAFVRAMATVYSSFSSPFSASFLISAWVALGVMSGSKRPP